ncbi:MAG: hypothetical protein WCE94_14175 [Candidatus Methanoperedens sp.]
MSENHQFNEDKPQVNADKRRCGLDLFGSLGNSSGLTPLSFDVDVRNNRDSVSNGFSTTERTENTEILRNSSGLSPLRPFGEINNRNMSDYLGEGFTATESTDTQRSFSGLSVPLSLCGEIHKKNMKSDYSDEKESTIDGTDISGNSFGLTPLHSGSEIFKRRVIE